MLASSGSGYSEKHESTCQEDLEQGVLRRYEGVIMTGEEKLCLLI